MYVLGHAKDPIRRLAENSPKANEQSRPFGETLSEF
jgi:hypothetical protein